jgi:hypothetical protein
VVVMQEGHKVGELTHGEASEERVLHLISQDSFA